MIDKVVYFFKKLRDLCILILSLTGKGMLESLIMIVDVPILSFNSGNFFALCIFELCC